LPNCLRGIMIQLAQFALKFLYLIGEQKKATEEEPSSSDDDNAEPSLAPYGEEEDEDDEGPVPEDQDVEAEYSTVTRLAHEAAELTYDPHEIEEDELVDDAIYTSPIDEIDEIVFFVQHMKAFADRDGQTYRSVINGMVAEEQSFYNALIQKAQDIVSKQ